MTMTLCQLNFIVKSISSLEDKHLIPYGVGPKRSFLDHCSGSMMVENKIYSTCLDWKGEAMLVNKLVLLQVISCNRCQNCLPQGISIILKKFHDKDGKTPSGFQLEIRTGPLLVIAEALLVVSSLVSTLVEEKFLHMKG